MFDPSILCGCGILPAPQRIRSDHRSERLGMADDRLRAEQLAHRPLDDGDLTVRLHEGGPDLEEVFHLEVGRGPDQPPADVLPLDRRRPVGTRLRGPRLARLEHAIEVRAEGSRVLDPAGPASATASQRRPG